MAGMNITRCVIWVIFLVSISMRAIADPRPFPVAPLPVIPLIPTTPTVGFAQSSGDANEGQGQATATIVLSQATSNQVSVFYKVGGSATGESDYSMQNGVLVFAPGQTSKTLTVPLINDKIKESNETLTITLTEPQNALLGQSNYSLTIHDND
jgi:hypothetical protein